MTSSSYYCDGSFVPAAGHYSFAFTPLFSGPNIISAIAFNTSGVSTHSFSIDNLKIGVTSAAGSVASYSADITSNTDYYPFGQTMPGRTWKGGDQHRYDFNGKESDKEVSGGFQDYGFRVNDKRVGRFFSVDPLRYDFPWYSPYQFAGNSPILNIDLDGLEDISINELPDKSISMQVVYTKKDVAEVKTPEKRIEYKKDGKVIKRTNQFEGKTKGAEQKLFGKLSDRIKGGIRNKDLLKSDEYEFSAKETISEPASETPAAKKDPNPRPNPNPDPATPATKTVKYAVFDIQVTRDYIKDFNDLGDFWQRTYIRDQGALYKQMYGLDQVIFRKITLVDKIDVKTSSYEGLPGTYDPGASPVIIQQDTKPLPADTPVQDQLP